jgi:hypothetical protein
MLSWYMVIDNFIYYYWASFVLMLNNHGKVNLFVRIIQIMVTTYIYYVNYIFKTYLARGTVGDWGIGLDSPLLLLLSARNNVDKDGQSLIISGFK